LPCNARGRQGPFGCLCAGTDLADLLALCAAASGAEVIATVNLKVASKSEDGVQGGSGDAPSASLCRASRCIQRADFACRTAVVASPSGQT
jgi:hypothetical protein